MGVSQDAEGEGRLRAFRTALENAGWRLKDQVDLNVVWAEGEPDRIGRLTDLILDWQPDVIVATATPIAAALKMRSVTRPVVFVNLVDPMGAGLIKSFASPGSNFTGLTNTEPTLAEKWLELLKEVSPKVERVGFLFHPNGTPFGPFRQILGAAAHSLNLSLFDLPVANSGEIDTAMSRCEGRDPAGVVVMTDLFTSTHHRLIVAATTRYRVPGIFPYRFFVSDGGLLSYSADLLELYARAAGYVDRVLRGAAPFELPVQTPSKYDLVVNLRTASALGLHIPDSITARTDEFIE